MKKNKQRNALIDQLQFLGQVNSTETAIFHQLAATKLGLGITDMKTVSILLSGPMTAGQIAQRLFLTTGAVTNVIDRLERSNIVKREPDLKDRRKVLVSVIPKALVSTNEIYQSMGEAFITLLSSYTTEELEFLVRFHQESIELTKLEIAKLTNRSI